MKRLLVPIALAALAIRVVAAQATPQVSPPRVAVPSQPQQDNKAVTRHLSEQERAVLRQQLYQFSRRTAKGS